MRKLLPGFVVAAVLAFLPATARAEDHGGDGWLAALWDAVASGIGDVVGGPEKTETFAWNGRLAGGTLEIKGVNGSIEAVAGSGDRVEVMATKRGRRADPAEVRIEVVPHAGGITVCAVYPSRGASKPNECAPGPGGRMVTRNNDVSVAFKVKVPAGVAFVGRTVNGSVNASGLGGNAEAYTVNGGVRVSAAGHVRGETTNGSVDLDLGRADWDGTLEAETVNGSVSVTLPAGASTGLRASTVNGRVTSDFALEGEVRQTRTKLSGTIGSGGRELRLQTVNGAIRVQKAS